MSAVSKQSETNHGGISRIKYAIEENISSAINLDELIITEATTIAITQSLIDNNFFDLHFLMRTANHDELELNNPAGISYRHNIELRFAKDRPDIQAFRSLIKNKKLVLLFKNNNSEWKLLYGVRAVSNHRTGKEPKDANSYTVTFSTLQAVPALNVSIS